MLTIRLPEDIETQLELMTKLEHRTKTEIMKAALLEYVGKHLPAKSAYELGKELFGRSSGGSEDISETYKDRIRKKLNEKHAR